MEKILLKFDEPRYNQYIAKLQSAKTKADTLLQDLKAICRIEYDSNTLQDVYAGNGDITARKIEGKVREELSIAGITSDTIIKLAVKGDLEKFYNLFNTKSQVEFDCLQYLAVEEGRVKVKENASDLIRETFCIYITTERGKEIYEKQVAITKAINDYIDFVPTANWANIHQYTGIHSGIVGRAETPIIQYDKL